MPQYSKRAERFGVAMMSSRKRYLQYLAAQRFYEEATGDFAFYQEDPSSFTEAELREEAAFRC